MRNCLSPFSCPRLRPVRNIILRPTESICRSYAYNGDSVNLWIFYSIYVFGVDLSSHGITDDIQLGCHPDNLIKKSVLFSNVESMHDNVTKSMSILTFSWRMLTIDLLIMAALMCIIYKQYPKLSQWQPNWISSVIPRMRWQIHHKTLYYRTFKV